MSIKGSLSQQINSRPRPCYRQQGGNAVILALMVCVMVAMMASTVPTLIGASEKQIRISRVKSVMTNIENRIRRVVMDPSSYNCPPVAGFANPASCTIDTGRLNSLVVTKLAGAQQCIGASCFSPQINFIYNGNTLVNTGSGMEIRPSFEDLIVMEYQSAIQSVMTVLPPASI